MGLQGNDNKHNLKIDSLIHQLHLGDGQKSAVRNPPTQQVHWLGHKILKAVDRGKAWKDKMIGMVCDSIRYGTSTNSRPEYG